MHYAKGAFIFSFIFYSALKFVFVQTYINRKKTVYKTRQDKIDLKVQCVMFRVIF